MPPVEISSGLIANVSTKPSTTLLVEEPCVEYATVLPAVSLMDLIGESARTYQNRSPAPVASDAMIRTGAPLEKAPMAPSVPPPTPISALRDRTAWRVSPL